LAVVDFFHRIDVNASVCEGPRHLHFVLSFQLLFRSNSGFDRLTRYKNFKEGHKRILVATDLVGRGIDIERVNIVVNYDMPDSADTYLHRVIVAPLLQVLGWFYHFIISF
jgi:hypothetical protein